MTLVDQDNRRRAMTDFTSVLLVEAAAGTGKTSLMAGRVAMMLANGHEPGEIAAITFTELAASQLARRIKDTVALGQLHSDIEFGDRPAWGSDGILLKYEVRAVEMDFLAVRRASRGL